MDAIGENLTVSTAETLAGTHAVSGTTEKGMKRALKKLEKRAVEWNVAAGSPRIAWSTMLGHLHQGQPVLLVVQEDQHWVVAVGTLGADRVVVVDSADGALVRSLSYNQLMPWWRGAEGGYYGIAVT